MLCVRRVLVLLGSWYIWMVLGLLDWSDVVLGVICTLVGDDTCTCLSTGFSISFETEAVDDLDTLTVRAGVPWTVLWTTLAAVLCGVAEEVPVVR